MKTKVIACEMLRDELEKAIKETSCKYIVKWVSSEYHIDPSKLREKLQQEIDAVKDADNILLVYGSCGNGLIGLEATTANLIIPKTDDCISLVLSKPNEKFERAKNTYFLTKGWMYSPKSILYEYDHTVKRYGEKRTERLFALMLKNYNYLMLIDTGAYDVEECSTRLNEFSKKLNLEPVISKGDIWFLKKILTGPYDNDFCVVSKGDKVTITHFGYNATSN